MSSTQTYARPVYTLSKCYLQLLQSESEAILISDSLARMDPWLTLSYSVNTLTRYLLYPDQGLYRYVAFTPDGIISGVICVRYPWLRGPYLELLGLFEAYQSQGIGSEMLCWFEEQAQLTSINAWVLVSAFNQGAYRFYRRHGFIKIGILKDLTKPGFDEILLRKVLTNPVLAA